MSLKLCIPSKEEIEEYYNQYGVSLSDVARRYNTSNPTVRNWMKKLNIERKSHHQSCKEKNSVSTISVRNNQNVIDDITNNMTIKDIEKKYNIGQATIYNIIEDNKIIRNTISEQCIIKWKQKNKFLYNENDVISSYENLKNLNDVADEHNISRSCVRSILVRNNIDISYDLSSWISKGHQELIDFCMMNNLKCVVNDRKLIKPLELDLIIDDKICIEYCGLYWHSEHSGKSKEYHLNKLKLVENIGLRLFTIFEHYDLEIIKSMILHSLGKTSNRIHARKCQIRSISTDEASIFENQNHIMGYRPAKYYYGLYYNDNLIQTMSFSKSRYDKNIDYEIIRSTIKKNTHVNGGVSKLISNFIKNFSANTLITYVDRTYGNGESYYNTKMKYSHKTPPNYYYFKDGKVYSRVSFQKHKLKSKLEIFDETKTEYENMLDNKWNRYWDCGNHVFIYITNKQKETANK